MAIDPIRFGEAVQLFNQGEFFECHEVLEDLWRPLPPGTEKTFLQGILQVGVGFHHWRSGNLNGARSLLEAGCEKLTHVLKDKDFHPPIALASFINASNECLAQARKDMSVLERFPKI
ncbi:MAG TPA: DUF309 domain-containing protein [Oculatellaceae cyanobacterium]